jgi:cobalamin synthase
MRRSRRGPTFNVLRDENFGIYASAVEALANLLIYVDEAELTASPKWAPSALTADETSSASSAVATTLPSRFKRAS